jgi:3-dehydroquinate synthase
MNVDYSTPLQLRAGEILTLSTGLAVAAPYLFGYQILDHLLENVVEAMGEDSADQIFIVSDPTVSSIYGKELLDALSGGTYRVHELTLPGGEEVKTFAHLENLCELLICRGATKRSVLVALGGGAVGNIVGLAASLLFRGIRHIEIPTSFTHQTDGTLSNKQAINGRTGKNHFGTYHAPTLIWSDTSYLASEPKRSRSSGLSEAVKNGFVDQPRFLLYLQAALRSEGLYTPDQLTDLAYKTVLAKLEILRKDPTERHYGAVLEYGHTFAHAMEWLSRGGLLHGEAVAFGMLIAARVAHRIGLLSADVVELHDSIIVKRLKMGKFLPDEITGESIMEVMRADNKRTSQVIRYCLLRRPGACVNPEGDYLMAVDDDTVLAVLKSFIVEVRDRAVSEGSADHFLIDETYEGHPHGAAQSSSRT